MYNLKARHKSFFFPFISLYHIAIDPQLTTVIIYEYISKENKGNLTVRLVMYGKGTLYPIP
jgi:hypothetical protein